MAAITTGLLGKNLREQIASLAVFKEQGNKGKQFAQVNAASVVMMGHKISHPRLESCPTDTATSSSSEEQPQKVLCTACAAPVLFLSLKKPRVAHEHPLTIYSCFHNLKCLKNEENQCYSGCCRALVAEQLDDI